MPHRTVTPETVFRPRPTSASESVFSFGEPSPRLSEQDQYKRLIDDQAAKQGMPLAHLADRLEIRRPRLHKVIRKSLTLKDDMRDRLFEALDIDCVRAKFCVTFLHDHTAYDDAEVFLICEAMKGFYCEIITRRRGEIQVVVPHATWKHKLLLVPRLWLRFQFAYMSGFPCIMGIALLYAHYIGFAAFNPS